jgi:hypothetical protein
MTRKMPIGGPLQFTEEEIREARKGNYGPVNRRAKKELAPHVRALKASAERTKAELKRLANKARSKKF